jgi:hypothetical protein
MRTWRVVLPVALLVVAVVACGVPMIGRPTPAPPAGLNPRDSAQRGAVLAFAASLIYAEDTGASHVYHGQYDRNLLDTLGTYGLVAPEVGMHRINDDDLKKGQIQLRVRIQPQPGYLAGYAPGTYGKLTPTSDYLFPPGVSYVWVDSLVRYTPPHGDTAGTAKIVVIPTDSSFVIATASIVVFRRDIANQAIARFSPAVCWDCMRSSWCALN